MTVTVELVRRGSFSRIHATGPECGPSQARRVVGSRFSKSTKTWTFPLDMHTCRQLRAVFGDVLVIGPTLTSWAYEERNKEMRADSLHALDPRSIIDLPGVRRYAPILWSAMGNRGYQTLFPAFVREVGPAFIADQPGTGKTAMMLAAIVEAVVARRQAKLDNTPVRVLVVAPSKALRATWMHEIKKWLADLDVWVAVADAEEGSGETRERLIEEFNKRRSVRDIEFLLVNPEMARVKSECPTHMCKGNDPQCAHKGQHRKIPAHPALFESDWDVQILDETHKVMMNANERAGSASQVGIGLQKLPMSADGVRMAASGTPFKGKPRRFWTVLHWLRPDKYTSQGRYNETYFESEADSWARSGVRYTEVVREDMRPQYEAELGRIMVRRTKAELRAINPAWAPPEKIHVPVVLEMEPRQKRAYDQMVAGAFAEIEGGSLMANGILAEMTRLKQFASAFGKLDEEGTFAPALPSNKWSWIKNVFLADRGILDGDDENPIKVVIASQFVALLDLFAAELRKLKVPFHYITGTTKNVDAIKDRWQSDYRAGDPRVMLLSTTAGGVSLTLDAADDLVEVDETFVPDDQEQVEDRVHRTSRTDHQVTIYHLTSKDTIDQAIYHGNMSTDEAQKRLLDGRRGVQFARLIAKGEAA